jgi:NAD(P)-dependent dehydrogenase (short-subunit alcohol dehydrogenase family)
MLQGMERGRVLVTGANSGLGLAITIEAARRGYDAIGTVRSEEKAKPLHDAAAEAGVEVRHTLLDVTDAERCASVVEEVGPLYGLVNNAGGGGTAAIEDVDDDEARQVLEAMLVAPIRLARLAIPGMRRQGRGRIVNISSIYGKASTPLTGWYQAAKHGLEGVSDALRMELARDRIAVVLVEPGAFRTNIFNEAEANMESREGSTYRGAYERSAQLVRLSEPFMGKPEQVAKVVGRALDARNPRDRYLVGLDAQAFDLAWRFTPRPIMDRVTRLTAGL